jgi:ribosomal protein S18 acetylase RimI-like enzyme
MNTKISYKDKKEFNKDELEDLFLSVEWSSGHFADKLVIAMKNFKTVYSAWDEKKLVGMVCVMDDGIMNAYVHYLLVNPKYHRMQIGRTLVDRVKKKYANYLRIAVIAYNSELNFYENCGFEKTDEASPMFITSLWT